MIVGSPTHPLDMESDVDPIVSTILRCLAPEEIDMLRDAFIYMDRDSDGYLSMEEMLRQVELSVPHGRYAPLREYLTPLFLVADKDGDGRLSLTEFLMSFADGPGVVPADVVNSCVAAVRVRLTDEEISALQENFRVMDADGDGYLNPEELEAALRRHLEPKFPELTEEQYREILAVIMSSADADQDGRLCLSEFIRSFQEDQGVLPASFVHPGFAEPGGSRSTTPAMRELTEEEADVLREAFVVLDKNDDGYIDFVDLYSALWESLSGQGADTTQIRDLCDLIMATADRRRTGRLSLSEFTLGFLRNMEVMRIPVAVAQEKARSACERLQTMYESGELERLVTVFEGLDSNGDGYLDRAELVGVLVSLFKDAFPEWGEEMLSSVMAAIVTGAETHTSGRISLEEFIRSFVDGHGILPPEAVSALDSRANAAARGRPDTASDDDLQRISDALRGLNETADADGCVTLESLRQAMEEAFTDQREAYPGKADAMYRYVLSRFVNLLEDGRLAWNENVQIEEDDEEDDGAHTRAPLDGSAQVPTSEQQEHGHPPDGHAVVVEAVAVVGEGEQRAAMRTQGSAGADRGAGAVEACGRRRRVVRAASVELDLGRGSDDSTHEEDTPPRDVIGTAVADSDTARMADGLATLPAVRERAVAAPPALLSSRKNSVGKSSGTKAGQLISALRYAPAAANPKDSGSIFEEELRALFKFYDASKLGYLDRMQFKKVYSSMEHYGLEPSQAEIDRQFTKYAKGSDKIFFDEFCVLMLQRMQL